LQSHSYQCRFISPDASKTRTEKQNRSGETIQTQGQYQNYGQMTSEQKQIRNQERKALKQQEKEMKKLQKEMRKQEAAQNRNKNMTQEQLLPKIKVHVLRLP